MANIDIAPTIFELAGASTPPEVDGCSLLPLLQGKCDWRDELLIEGWPQDDPVPNYAGVLPDRDAYLESEGNEPELYDLVSDPRQLQNLAERPEYSIVVTDLPERLEQARGSRRANRISANTRSHVSFVWLSR